MCCHSCTSASHRKRWFSQMLKVKKEHWCSFFGGVRSAALSPYTGLVEYCPTKLNVEGVSSVFLHQSLSADGSGRCWGTNTGGKGSGRRSDVRAVWGSSTTGRGDIPPSCPFWTRLSMPEPRAPTAGLWTHSPLASGRQTWWAAVRPPKHEAMTTRTTVCRSRCAEFPKYRSHFLFFLFLGCFLRFKSTL